jgi:hypothetical protein
MFIYKITKTKRTQKMSELLQKSRESTPTPASSPDDDLENIFALESVPDRDYSTPPDSPESADTPTSPLADIIQKGTDRLVGFLNTRAETAGDRREAHTEAIDSLRQTGRNALATTKEAVLVSAAMTFITYEAVSEKVQSVRQKISAFGMQARVRVDERQAHIENNRIDRDNAFTRDHEEAMDTNKNITAQRKADQEVAYDSYGVSIAATERRETAEAMIDEHDSALELALAQRNAARAAARKQARHERRQEIKTNVQERGKRLLNRGRSIGKSALGFLKRTKSAIGAGAKAAKESFQQR